MSWNIFRHSVSLVTVTIGLAVLASMAGGCSDDEGSTADVAESPGGTSGDTLVDVIEKWVRLQDDNEQLYLDRETENNCGGNPENGVQNWPALSEHLACALSELTETQKDILKEECECGFQEETDITNCYQDAETCDALDACLNAPYNYDETGACQSDDGAAFDAFLDALAACGWSPAGAASD